MIQALPNITTAASSQDSHSQPQMVVVWGRIAQAPGRNHISALTFSASNTDKQLLLKIYWRFSIYNREPNYRTTLEVVTFLFRLSAPAGAVARCYLLGTRR